MIWKPHVTVAAVIEQDGKFLLVEEETDDGPLFNQPAGHWEPGETLTDGVIREAQEETAYTFTPQSLLGIYSWHHPRKDITYLRFAFTGSVGAHDTQQSLDTGIIRAVWLTLDEMRATRSRHRSPLVLQCVEDYLAGRRFPLDLISHY
ncbi:NUDIX hydrolase [Sulfurimicrobium lacus]|uniref:Phosphatase NudJ n=1 Tax=Sulfurimicrobium lacus TaxID=2715678 RepID=A0A6F8VBI9_9PROT|nr:NUDIX hydrolase [Sulfurimicrobium lacus]BCB26332.1 NUDIX hydrolase [Sulfurimicrobium lacus]